MDAIAVAFVVVSGVAWIAGAVVLIGAVIAVGRADHRNPAAYRWIAWHERHSSRHH
jgi:predicted lysophospholipase L1 biosynthesis ABC-type transport system permease subunit